MRDEYTFLRSQYEAIMEHCEYLMSHSVDPGVRARATESHKKAHAELARLNRQLASAEFELAIP